MSENMDSLAPQVKGEIADTDTAVVSADDARRTFGDLLSRVQYGGERIVIRRGKRDAVAVVPLSDLETLRRRAA